MKQIRVTYRKRTEPSKTSVTNNLQWYDPIKKELLTFSGGQLEFEYKEDSYLTAMSEAERVNRGIKSTFRLLPKVSDLKINSSSEILDNKLFINFFDNYLNYNVSHINADISNDKFAICFVPDEEYEDFSYQLERQGFNYE